MNKIYKATTVKNRGLFVGDLVRKVFPLLIGLIGMFGSAQGQVSVTATGGVLGPTPYTTVQLAFAAINGGTHRGAITVSISANTTETVMASLNSSGTGSASYTSVLVRPTSNATVTGNLSTAIIQLFGADNVTINGLNGASQLTISNTSTNTSSAVIWVASASATDGATSNTISNCIIAGNAPTTTLAAIASSSGVTIGGVAEAANNSNTYLNNTITACQVGIGLVGPTGNETNNVISGNTIGSVVAANKLGFKGIISNQQQNVLISQNNIFGVTSTSGSLTLQTSGIFVGGTANSGLIEKNIIRDIKITSVWGCNGIQLNSSTSSTGLTVANNFIYDVVSGGFSDANSIDDGCYGIAVNTGGGYNIYYNSVDMSTNMTSTSPTVISSAFWVSPDITSSIDVRDNIFSNRQTSGTRYAAYSNLANTIFTSINYNDYYSLGSVGFLGSARATLANWQTATAQDANSLAIDPNFFTTTNLHLQFSSGLNNMGIPIGAITRDIDGDSRLNPSDIGADEFTPGACSLYGGNTGGTATATISSICASGSTTLSATGYGYGLGISYQWEYFNGASWVPLAGQTNPVSAVVGSISATTQYRLAVTCPSCCGGAPGYSNTVTITVNNPTITSSSSGTPPCGTGTATLSATAAGTLNWYAAATGGSSLFTGSPFVTPTISSNTTFYVTSSVDGATGSGGKASTAGADGGFNGTNTGLVFDATTAFRLVSVKMYPQGPTSATIEVQTSAGVTVPGCTHVEVFAGATSTGFVVPLNFTIPAGTGYKLVLTANSGSVNIWRDFSGNAFPYPVGTSVNITGGWNVFSSTNYYYFYDWQTVEICEGLRTPVVAVVTSPPAFTSVSPAAGAPRTICSGSSVTLNAAGGGYTSYVWNPGAIPNGTVVSPTVNTTYTVTATSATCRRDSAINIIVNPTPTPITVTPSTATTCNGIIVPIAVTGGQLVGQTVFNENFETFPLTQMTVTGSGVTATQNTTYYQQGNSSVLLTPGNGADGQLAMVNSVNLSNYQSPKLSFYHICATETTFDFGYIQYSTDGGTSWTSFPTSSYLGSGTLVNGVVSFDPSSYSDWNSQFTSSSSTPGAGPATSLWKLETIDLSAYQSSTTFKVRFRLTTDGSFIYSGWFIDNVSITGTGQAAVTWTPCGPGSELYSDPGATTLVSCGVSYTQVYTKPTVNHVYTATATGGVGCTQTGTSTITVIASAPPSVTIAAVGGTTICQGDCVTFNATVLNGGGNPGYKWFVNNVQVNLPASFNTNPGQNPYTICGLNTGDVVECQILSNAGICATPNPSPRSPALTFTVNPKPSVSINQSGAQCFPQTLTLTTTGTIASYQWLLNGANAPGGNLSTYNATVAGTYSCIVTSNQGCKDTATDVILTQQTYTITASATNGTISPSGAVVLNCGANQVFTYTANPGYQVCDVLIDGVSIGAAASPYTFTNVTANHTIDIQFCNPGCASVYTAFAGNDASVCGNVNYTLGGSISSTPAVPGFAATWSTSGDGTFNPSSNVFGTAVSYTPGPNDIINGTVDLTLTTNDPLGSPCAAAASTMTLTVKPFPAITVSGLQGVCTSPNTNANLTASATIASGTITTYQWYNSVPTLIGSLASQVISTTGNYSVKVTASNGCFSTSPVTIVAFSNPSQPVISGTTTICVGTSTTLTASVASPGNNGATIPANGFQWFNPASIGGATSQVYNTGTPASYTVTATNSNGCSSAASVASVVAYDNTPLNGAYTIGVGPASCTNYVSFATAIADLNLRTIGGNVRFDVPAGYTETVPVGGLALGSVALNASTAGRAISFQKSGVGANPVLNAFVGVAGPSSNTPDGVWSLRGVDNVTINSIDIADGNSTNPATMEYGFGLFKLSATDGAQNNTIQNCTITLKRTNDISGSAGVPMPDGATGIVVANALATLAPTAITPTSAAGANSNNKFYSNTIQNCNTGIALMGYLTTTSPFTLADVGNDIGGIASGTGNSILNYGGAAASTASAVAIRLNNQWGANVSYNTINNNNGSGANHLSILRGILCSSSANTSASISINNNSITLKSSATGGQQMSAIENSIGQTPAGNTVTISNNTVTGIYTTANTSAIIGITNTANAATVNITGNTVDTYAISGTGTYTGISNAAAATTVNLNSNTLSNCNITSTGTFVGISNTVGGVVNLNMSFNTISGITKVFNTGTINLMQTSGSTNATVNDNIITNNAITATAATANVTLNCILGNTSIYTLNNNYIFNNSITGMPSTFVGAVNGYNNISTPSQNTISNNTIRKLFVTGTSTGTQIVQGINSIAAAAGAQTVSNNTVANLYTTSTMVSTIYAIRTSNGTTVNVFRNKIDSLFPGTGAASIGVGIRTQNGTTINVHNNFINLDLTQATAPAANSVLTGSDALKGLEITDATAGHVMNLYYNTIRLAGAGSGATFGTSGVSIFSNLPTVDMRNNIIVNLTTPGGTSPGFAVAYRRPGAVGATYASTSNNNLFYAGTPSASRLLYFDGSTGYQTLAAYQAGAGINPRETASVSVSPNFINPVSDLHLVPGSNCSTDGGAQVIAGYTADYDADTRNVTTPDIGADEFAGTGVGVGVWKGVNTDWNDIQNWCDAVPNSKTNVTIPAGAPNYPLITTATPVCNNISIAANASVTITGVGKLGIYGTTMTNAGTFNVVDGTIEMLGNASQTIPAGLFQNDDLKNLIISSTGASTGVTLGGALNIYGKVSFTVGSKAFATAGFLTLKSNAAGTASVGDITNNNTTPGNTITGDVTVERFVTARRAWRFLSVPTQNNLQTIHQAWQENQAAGVGAPAGFGVQITSNLAGWAAAGFDLFSAGGPSVKTYVPASNSYAGIPNTSSNFTTGTGYMTFVRGDRTITTFGPPANTTVLRDKGALVTGTFAAPAIGAGLFAAIGNPFASAVDYTKLTKSNLTGFYYLWDPALGTFGAYQTVSGGVATPGGGSYGSGNVFIESGQAFFVKSSGLAGSLSFPENSKVDGSYLVSRPTGNAKQLRTNLYLVDSTGRHLYDGVSSEFDGSYTAALDELDAVKLVNFGENLGIRRADKILSIESMPELVKTDTIFYNLDQMRVKNYQFEFIATNINQPGLEAFLEDRYLNVKTPVGLSDTTRVDFNIINDPGSYAVDRFRLVFKELAPVPVTFTSIRANRQANNILVEWKIENELNIHHYDVEKSANGLNFSKVGEQVSRGNGSGAALQYNWLDTNPFDGDNFYRVRSVGISNEVKLSQTVKVNMGKLASTISIYPNPVREDGMLYISLSNKPAGNYQVSLVNNEGQTILKRSLNHAGGNSVYSIALEKLVAHGNYLVNITGDNNVNLTFKIVY